MKKILIVDDEQETRNVINERLSQNGYLTTTASNGKEALDACKLNLPDLILLDIAMPVMNGYETCENLKKDVKTQNIPILFVTGQELDPQGILKRCKDLSACGYLYKPTSLQDLLAKIKEILGEG